MGSLRKMALNILVKMCAKDFWVVVVVVVHLFDIFDIFQLMPWYQPCTYNEYVNAFSVGIYLGFILVSILKYRQIMRMHEFK